MDGIGSGSWPKSSGNGGAEMSAPATTMLPSKRLQWFYFCEQDCSISGTSG
jgi:hypothetical protein